MFIVAAFLFGIIIFFAVIGFDMNPVEDNNLEKVVVVEGYENSFCKSFIGNSGNLNKQCGELTKKNCLKTDCCVYAKIDEGPKCYAGNKDGPTYRFDKNGKSKNMDYYYYKDECFGANCKKAK